LEFTLAAGAAGAGVALLVLKTTPLHLLAYVLGHKVAMFFLKHMLCTLCLSPENDFVHCWLSALAGGAAVANLALATTSQMQQIRNVTFMSVCKP